MEDWVFLILAFVVVDIVIIFYVSIKGKRNKLPEHEKKRLSLYWQKIKDDTDLKHAVINADKLLDEVLRIKGFQGTLGEKLKKAENLIDNYDGIWKAHKLRNRIAHEMDHHFSSKEGHASLKNYERTFKDLGLL